MKRCTYCRETGYFKTSEEYDKDQSGKAQSKSGIWKIAKLLECKKFRKEIGDIIYYCDQEKADGCDYYSPSPIMPLIPSPFKKKKGVN